MNFYLLSLPTINYIQMKSKTTILEQRYSISNQNITIVRIIVIFNKILREYETIDHCTKNNENSGPEPYN